MRLTAPERYTGVAITLHWLTAFFIIANLCVGYFMESLPGHWRLVVVDFHISSGITVLCLALLRLLWRLWHSPPPLIGAISPTERRLAKAAHVCLYVAMIVMPLIGWAIVSAHPPAGSAGESAAAAHAPNAVARERVLARARPHHIWGTVSLPSLPPVERMGAAPAGLRTQAALHDSLVRSHGIGGAILIALLGLHVLGALKHQWLEGERELQRMFWRSRPRAASPPP